MHYFQGSREHRPPRGPHIYYVKLIGSDIKPVAYINHLIGHHLRRYIISKYTLNNSECYKHGNVGTGLPVLNPH